MTESAFTSLLPKQIAFNKEGRDVSLNAAESFCDSHPTRETDDSESERGIESAHSDPTAKLQSVLKVGVALDVIHTLLDLRADPNAPMTYKRTKEITGSAFTLAVSLCRKEIVLALVYAKADVNSEYTFTAGAAMVLWSGPVVCATITRKSVAMMRLLVDLSANIDGRLLKFNGEPNGTLLYEACYIGCAPCVRYLLKRTSKKELNVSVKFQDDLSKSFSPLAIAAHRGHSDVVRLLLEHQASISTNDASGCGPPMLVDAIHMCNLDVVKQLVMASADIFTPTGPDGQRGIDYILRSENSNSVIMAAVAQGLKYSTNEARLRDLRIDDIVLFLWTSSADEILDAIFRPRLLQSWVVEPGNTGRPMRKDWRTAHVTNSKIPINVAEGPDIEAFTKQFEYIKKNVLRRNVSDVEKSVSVALREMTDVKQQEFLQTLTSCYSSSFRFSRSQRQVPAEFCQCLVPNVHCNVEVILAIARSPNHSLFDHPGAQAIVMHGWRACYTQYQLTFFFNLALALLFFLMSVILQAEDTDSVSTWKWITIVVILIIWSRNVFYEVMQMIGLIMLGHGAQYFLSVENYIDLGRILLTLASIVIILNSDSWNVTDTIELKTILATTMWIRWIRVLYSARGFEMSGQHMLAILYAVGSVWPFLSVVMWPLIGFINCYYMMGVYDVWRSGIIVYRMAFVGDFDLEEVEDIDPTMKAEGDPLTDGYYQEIDPVLSDKHKVIGVFMVIVTMFFTIALMNIFIGVLSESYHRYFERRDRLFLMTRAGIVLEHAAVEKASYALSLYRLCSACRRADRIYPITRSESHLVQRDSGTTYLWYCRQKKADELGLADEDDEDVTDMSNIDTMQHRMESMRVEMEKLKEQMATMSMKAEASSTKQMVMLQEISKSLDVEVKTRGSGHIVHDETELSKDMPELASLMSKRAVTYT